MEGLRNAVEIKSVSSSRDDRESVVQMIETVAKVSWYLRKYFSLWNYVIGYVTVCVFEMLFMRTYTERYIVCRLSKS